jgi:hypothetical protein
MASDDPLPDPRSAARNDDDAEIESTPWDANDARRKDDQFAPPETPCECHCLHCGRVFMSDGIWFQKVVNDPSGFDGFWKCPTPNCGGAGFTFDIFPTDPDHPANAGWVCDDGEDDEEFCDDEDDDPSGDWDPDERKYKALDEALGDEGDDDIEGEEWKYGLQPGEQPPEPAWAEEARKRWEDEQKQYDEPDRRPRELDWSDREDRCDPVRGQFNDDDIPF